MRRLKFLGKYSVAVIDLFTDFLPKNPRKVVRTVGPDFNVGDFIYRTPQKRFMTARSSRCYSTAILVLIDENLSVLIRYDGNHLRLDKSADRYQNSHHRIENHSSSA